MGLKEILKQISDLAKSYLIDKPYIVGGLPRDIYMKIPDIKTTDVDITTNSPEVLRLGVLLADHLNNTFELADDGHLTVFSDEFDVDFSSHFISSKVVEFLKGKHPGLEEAFSRDFTINTLHQDLITDEISDPTGNGFEDIKNKLIRTPVPAEITLTDDPRRAYRAVELAARYNFEIDKEIKDFVIANPEKFSQKNIKDKYIAIKINKALKINEDLTLKLLKEMKLMDDVPLAGHFKDVLIRKKILVDYLENSSLDKFAQEVAHNWEDYVAQGPEYQAVKNWWESNFNKIPNSNPSYQSWNQWYMSHYRGEWNFSHKSPEETIQAMEQDANHLTLNDRASRIKEIGNLLGSDTTSNQEINSDDQFDYISVRSGVNIENTTSDVKYFLKVLGEVAKKMDIQKPTITSGWRSVESQAEIMAKNWFDNGGAHSGRRYLEKLYGQNFGGEMASIFEKYGTSPEAISLAIKVIESQPNASRHILNPSQAVDFAVTPGIRTVLNKVKSLNIFNMKIIDESESAGPNYHVTIYGTNDKKYNFAKRREVLFKMTY